jgi:carboxylesterase type B
MLSSVASKSLALFARDGKPDWPQYDTNDRPTFVLDDECRLEQQPDDELHNYWMQVLVNETN